MTDLVNQLRDAIKRSDDGNLSMTAEGQPPSPTDSIVCQRQYLEQAIIAALANQAKRVNVSVVVMRATGGADYYVQFECNGRTGTPHYFKERYKAEYHVAFYKWLFNGGERPDLMDYNEDSWPGKTA